MYGSKPLSQGRFGNDTDRTLLVTCATVLAFALVYLISAIAKTDGLGGTESLAYLTADALFANEVYLGSFGEVEICGFACRH